MSRIGIAISGGPNPAEIIDLVVLAESLGYESAWVAEGHGGDQFAVLAACARETLRIGLGTGITSWGEGPGQATKVISELLV